MEVFLCLWTKYQCSIYEGKGMKLIKTEDRKSFIQSHYDNGGVITHFYTSTIYFHDRVRVMYEKAHKRFTYTTVHSRDFAYLQEDMMPLPDFTRLNEEQLFQASLIYDVDLLLPIQVEIKEINKSR